MDLQDANRRTTSSVAKSCLARQDRLRRWLADLEIDSLLISHDRDVFYLTGFVGHDSRLLIWDDGAAIVTDRRFEEALTPWRNGQLGDVVMGVRHRLHETVANVCRQHNLRRVGVESHRTTLHEANLLAEAIAPADLTAVDPLLVELRMVKDDIEIASIEKAASIQVAAFDAALEHLAPGITEQQWCARLEFEMKSRGAVKPSFDIIVASGANSAVPHHETGSTAIEEGVLLVDWGVHVDGYNSDMTRTLALGSMPDKIRDIYRIVLDAQTAAIEACMPGKTCAEVDAVARDLITEAGYGEQFNHGLGHGLGLDVHEPPFFNQLSTDVVLQPGMVMTIEPGIYLAGIGGVRIEDDVLVTETGCRLLSNAPKELNELIGSRT